MEYPETLNYYFSGAYNVVKWDGECYRVICETDIPEYAVSIAHITDYRDDSANAVYKYDWSVRLYRKVDKRLLRQLLRQERK